MTREEKCKKAIELGYTYNPESGDVIGIKGKPIIAKKDGYIDIQSKVFYKLKAHIFAWYYIYGETVDQIDHINGIRDDNRLCNLRAVNNQQNQQNRTKAKGYGWHTGTQKWRAYIKGNGKYIHIGLFDNESDARQAYIEAKKIYHI